MELDDPWVGGQTPGARSGWEPPELVDGGGGEVEVAGQEGVAVLGPRPGVDHRRAARRAVVGRQPGQVEAVVVGVDTEGVGHAEHALGQDRVVLGEPAPPDPLDRGVRSQGRAGRRTVHGPSGQGQVAPDLPVGAGEAQVADGHGVLGPAAGDNGDLGVLGGAHGSSQLVRLRTILLIMRDRSTSVKGQSEPPAIDERLDNVLFNVWLVSRATNGLLDRAAPSRRSGRRRVRPLLPAARRRRGDAERPGPLDGCAPDHRVQLREAPGTAGPRRTGADPDPRSGT